MSRVPRHFAYDSEVLEFCWRWGRILFFHTYKEIRARLLFLMGRGSYTFFAHYRRDWIKKVRRPRMAP